MKGRDDPDLVVCVNGVWIEILTNRLPPNSPVKGGVYTVVGRCIHDGVDGYFLAEFPSDTTWAVDQFRPVRRTSIEVFRKLLAPTPETVA